MTFSHWPRFSFKQDLDYLRISLCKQSVHLDLLFNLKTNVLRPMQTDATSANNSQHCWVLLANNVASVCMSLKV